MTLYLFPNLLGPVADHHYYLPASVDHVMAQIDGLIAESEGEGRRYLKHFQLKKKPHEMPIALLTKQSQDLDFLLRPILNGEIWGVVSDCGLPCLADPGAALVRKAYSRGLQVKTFSGPSSITYALILSGLSAQAFTFHGYIPKDPNGRGEALKEWEAVEKMTHLFIEAPYRNVHTFQACLHHLKPSTLLCVATSLTLPEEWIHTTSISEWKKKDSETIINKILKKPTIFLIYP